MDWHGRARSKTIVAFGWLAGLVLALGLASNAAAQDQDSVVLDLKDADIRALVETVSELTGKSFIIDPRVKGRVTVVSSHEVRKEELYRIFLSVLEVHGFTVVPSGEVYKIIPTAKGKQTAPAGAPGGGRAGDEMVTHVIQLEHVPAQQLVPVLRPLMPQEAHLGAYGATNVLIVSDRSANVERLLHIIARIDRAGDQEIDVIPLENASAGEIVRILSALQQKGAGGKGGAQPVQLVADERTNSVLLSGDRPERLRLKALIGHLDTPLKAEGNTHVIYLRYAKAKDLVPVLTGVSKTLEAEQTQATANRRKPPISIQADEASNALVITAPPDVFRSLKQVVSQLDVRRAQVLVEAIIAEVSIDYTRELGIQWVVDATPGGSGPVGVINFGGSGSGIVGIATGVNQGNPSVPDGALVGIGQFDNSTINFAALLRALANDATTNILSTPSIMTLDNQEAEIVVGQNVPFVTGEFTNTGGSTSAVNPFRTIQREDVGLTLRVIPQINEGNAIKLEIEQEVSSISPSPGRATDLITNTRKIKTTVMADNGQTIVLGGLVDEDLQHTQQKVPGLGDAPIIGPLFQYQRTSKVKRTLLVFLRPVIVRDAATQTHISEGKYRFMRAQQLDMRRRGTGLARSDEAPLLPEDPVELPAPF